MSAGTELCACGDAPKFCAASHAPLARLRPQTYNTRMNKYELLKKHFGYDSFREGQERLIDAILAGCDVLGVMPTGAGKSICYQIPALMLPGITLVVSPLISLMKDQVGALRQAGVAAAYLNSSLTPGQYRKALANAMAGMYRIIYVAPERLATPGFQAFARSARLSLVAVDEAHCVSQWGHDFRPGYLAIADFVESLPARPAVAAFTATATERVRRDITALLRLKNPETLVTGFNRPNLYFEVRRVTEGEKRGALLGILAERRQQAGIVYCATRKAVEAVCELLEAAGYAATRYHAGLSDEERRQNQEAFLFDEKPVMVATNAFGMGIDKSNVSYVIHYNMPKDPESYYQEAGRAGRDGEPAACILLYSGRDVKLNEFLIEKSLAENTELDDAQKQTVRQESLEWLKRMTFYCTGRGCLRAYLLRYFGEEAPARCNGCANCLSGVREEDVTDMAQEIVECVDETGGRYGAKRLIDILRGDDEDGAGLARFGCFGALSSTPRERIGACIDALLADGYLTVAPGQYRSVQAGQRADEVRRGLPCVLSMPVTIEKPRGRARARAAAAPDQPLYERLVELRRRLAFEKHIPPYLIFTNATLEDMSARRPLTRVELLAVSGVGERKAAMYGDAFLGVIRESEKGNGR